MKNKLVRLLSRKTNTLNFIPEIDGLRFFAIGSVLFLHLGTHYSRSVNKVPEHALNWLGRVSAGGGVGVNVFFTLSGFILALPFALHYFHAGSKVELRSYYYRRLTRLEPPYLLSLTILLLVQAFILRTSLVALLPHYWASFFYVHNIVYDKWSTINPVTWSLEVEVQFYLLVPLLVKIFNIKNLLTRRSVLLLIIALSIINYNVNKSVIDELHLRKSIIVYLHQFLIGFFFVDIFLNEGRLWFKKKYLIYDIAGILVTVGLFIFNDFYSILNQFVVVLLLFSLLIITFKGVLFNWFYTRRWIVIIGGMCYSIYLLHYPIIFLIVKFTSKIHITGNYALNLALQALLVLPVVIIISSVFFVLIEKPCMDKTWPQKLVAFLHREKSGSNK